MCRLSVTANANSHSALASSCSKQSAGTLDHTTVARSVKHPSCTQHNLSVHWNVLHAHILDSPQFRQVSKIILYLLA